MEHYTPESFMVTESVGFALSKALNLMASEMDAALKPLDMTSAQMGILLLVRAGVAHSPFELSKQLSIDTGLMTRLIDKLENKGWVGRSRSVDDRRVVNLALTKEGEAIAGQIPEIAPRVLNARLHKFSTVEFEELGRLLRKFTSD
ncbi:MAG TPA: MarR family transcriptional regulator [Paraburkholderia sp.]|uniref:MarR family winged helix-turn-helix transcriptional regulator n=1 Tax=Paraburkholderia sp. TaxID=1926495 RepID=UPI002B80CD92|nr:MarR family transcriptional regulator [Paraburkholderia sp.]HTR06050.1 MarR family transcriptional regulator [Paraburkholderia sp.]